MENSPPISQVFAGRVKEIRRTQPGGKLSQEALARRILELRGSRPTDAEIEVVRVMVSRTEAGKRTVSIDDVFEFAAALGVSPLALLLPEDAWSSVRLTGPLVLEAGFVQEWLRGELPLRREDVAIYEAAKPRMQSESGEFFSDWVESVILSPAHEAKERLLENEAVRESLRASIQNERLEHVRMRGWMRKNLETGSPAQEGSEEMMAMRDKGLDAVENAITEFEAKGGRTGSSRTKAKPTKRRSKQ